MNAIFKAHFKSFLIHVASRFREARMIIQVNSYSIHAIAFSKPFFQHPALCRSVHATALCSFDPFAERGIQRGARAGWLGAHSRGDSSMPNDQ
jgi:hypothetical protein